MEDAGLSEPLSTYEGKETKAFACSLASYACAYSLSPNIWK
jgi:hypothetical protein